MGLQALGYEIAVAGVNQWNGVALVSRVGLEDVQVGFDGMPGYGEPVATESRAIGAVCGGVRIWSLYVPNGRKPDDPHYLYKLDWLATLRAEAGPWLGEDAALVGDWNVAPRDEDVFDMAQFAKSTHVTPKERAAFQGFLDDGWVDVVRPHTPGSGRLHLLGLLPAALRAEPRPAHRLHPRLPLAGRPGDPRVHRPGGARRPGCLGPRPRARRPGPRFLMRRPDVVGVGVAAAATGVFVVHGFDGDLTRDLAPLRVRRAAGRRRGAAVRRRDEPRRARWRTWCPGSGRPRPGWSAPTTCSACGCSSWCSRWPACGSSTSSAATCTRTGWPASSPPGCWCASRASSPTPPGVRARRPR